MFRFVLLLLCAAALALPANLRAEPQDIAAAARGVVRVVVIGSDGEEIFPISHGTGFAVSPTRIVTNAHVVSEALADDSLRIGVVTSEGDDAVYAKTLAVSRRNDLALIELTGDLRLPPLTIAGGVPADSGEVTAVGYPMNVDRAQGLQIGDIFRSQPPVTARGFLSGARPSREFDTILHTAPIARGNSGGPLLDACGRVLGVNSFGADSGGSDAEFFFAVSTRELLPFLRENNVDLRVNALPCRSMAELDASEQDRQERLLAAQRAEQETRARALRERRERIGLEAEQSVLEDRENAIALAFLLVLSGWSAASYAVYCKRRGREDKRISIASGIAGAAFVGALVSWFSRPGLDEIDTRIAQALTQGQDDDDDAQMQAGGTRKLVCTLDVARSRVTSSQTEDITLEWSEDGCVNGRTQYGLAGGSWSRVFVPNGEAAVSVNRFDPDTLTFRTDRYLLNRAQMSEARAQRRSYTPPQCETENAASLLGEMQSSVTAKLPERANERLVYQCSP